MANVMLIEGIGDEVTSFFLLVLLGALAILAWWSTRVSDRPLRIQTIIVGQRVIHVNEGDRRRSLEDGEQTRPAAGGVCDVVPQSSDDRSQPEDVLDRQEVRGVSQLERRQQEEDDQAPDSSAAEDQQQEQHDEQHIQQQDHQEELNVLRQRRLLCFGPQNSPASGSRELASDTDVGSVLPSAVASDDSHSAVRDTATSSGPVADEREASEPSTPRDGADLTSACRETPEERTHGGADTEQNTGTELERGRDGQSIAVKLKFLNDTQRLVEGDRQEALSAFKRRHFPAETAANRLVRLIFNGRLLSDQATLDQCGLYHNCVVHCHVSAEPRPAADHPPAAAAAEPHQLDLGVLLYPVLTSVVTLVWGLRLRCPELFSTLAVVLLAVLTLLLTVFAAASFLPLQWRQQHQEQQQERRPHYQQQ